MLFQDVVFWMLSVMAIGGALGVVLVPDLFRAALLLIVVFIAVAGFFVLLNAEFLAVVQVLIYVGAISVLLGMIQMLNNLDDPARMGPAVAMALLSCLYGGVLAILLVVAGTVASSSSDWTATISSRSMKPTGLAAGAAAAAVGAAQLRKRPGWDPTKYDRQDPQEALRDLGQQQRSESAYEPQERCADCETLRQETGDETGLCEKHLGAALGM